jgi:ferredoxin-NADP reductase
MKVTLINKHREVGDVTTFWLKPEQPVSWKAGQYGFYKMDIANPDEEGNERYFTIASAPFEDHLQITTRIRPSSFKQALDKLEPGQALELDSIDGNFVVEDPSKHYIFLAGGIGITPFRSILLDLDHAGQPLNVTLLYASRPEVVFKDELADLAARHPEFSLQLVLDPQRLDEATIRHYVPDPSASIFYVSGPKPMVKAMAELLTQMGVAKEQIKRDSFPGYETI